MSSALELQTAGALRTPVLDGDESNHVWEREVDLTYYVTLQDSLFPGPEASPMNLSARFRGIFPALLDMAWTYVEQPRDQSWLKNIR
jgi:hypothetical protein